MHPALKLVHQTARLRECGKEKVDELDRHLRLRTPTEEVGIDDKILKAAYSQALGMVELDPIPIKRGDVSPEEWTRHISEVRKASAARAVEVIKAKAKGRKKMTSIGVDYEDAEFIREGAAKAGKPVAKFVHELVMCARNDVSKRD